MSDSKSFQFDERQKLRLLWIVVFALAAAAVMETIGLMHFQPPAVDYLPLWTAGRMAWSDAAHVYDFAAVTHPQAWLLPHLHGMRPYAYPPTALLLFAPLGALPFWASFALWLGLSLAVFLYAGWRLADGRRFGLVAALMLLSPAVVMAILVGQTVLLSAGLAALAVVKMKRRPRLAGALLAIAAIKPQALLLAPLALVAAGAGETLAAAALVEVGLIALSVICFGPARWSEWIGSLPAFQAVIDHEAGLQPGLITPAGIAHTVGLSGIAGWMWRGAFGLFAAVLVWRAFARPSSPAVRTAALMAGGLMVAPYALEYDGTLLVPAAVAMAVETQARGWTRRMLGLCAVSEITLGYIGALAVPAFAALSGWTPSLRPAPASDTALTAEPSTAG